MEESLKAWLYDPAVGRVALASASLHIVETPALEVRLQAGRRKDAP